MQTQAISLRTGNSRSNTPRHSLRSAPPIAPSVDLFPSAVNDPDVQTFFRDFFRESFCQREASSVRPTQAAVTDPILLSIQAKFKIFYDFCKSLQDELSSPADGSSPNTADLNSLIAKIKLTEQEVQALNVALESPEITQLETFLKELNPLFKGKEDFANEIGAIGEICILSFAIWALAMCISAVIKAAGGSSMLLTIFGLSPVTMTFVSLFLVGVVLALCNQAMLQASRHPIPHGISYTVKPEIEKLLQTFLPLSAEEDNPIDSAADRQRWMDFVRTYFRTPENDILITKGNFLPSMVLQLKKRGEKVLAQKKSLVILGQLAQALVAKHNQNASIASPIIC